MLDNYRDLIDELLGTPSTLRGLFAANPAPSGEALRRLAELRNADATTLDRLQRLTREHDPVLPTAGAPSDAEPGTATDLLAGFDAARGEVVSLLMNLTLRDWERTGLDAGGETVRLADEVERHVEFDEAQVARIRAALGG